MNYATFAVAGLFLTFTVSGVEAAEASYPSRPIRFIVPYAPGGPSDILARHVGQKLNESMGQTIVIDNRGSVGGVFGLDLGAKSAPDGYTIVLAGVGGLTINPHVYLKLPYDPQRDFQPVTQLTTGGDVMVVPPSVAATSIREFIALAKAKPGQLNYATTGTNNLLGIGLFKIMAGIDMVAIPYKGTGQAVIDLLAGHVQFFSMSPPVAMPHVKSGKLRGLAVTSTTRNPALPDMPTVAESGLPGYEAITWHSIVVPAKTPKPIVKRLNTELVRIVNLPDVKEHFLAQGLIPVGSTPEQLSALIKKESIMYAKLIKQIGLEPQ